MRTFRLCFTFQFWWQLYFYYIHLFAEYVKKAQDDQTNHKKQLQEKEEDKMVRNSDDSTSTFTDAFTFTNAFILLFISNFQRLA